MARQMPPVEPQTYVKVLNLLFYAVMAGVIIFAVIAWFISQNQPILIGEGEEDPYKLIFPIVSLALAGAGYMIFQMFVQRISPEATFKKRLTDYRTATLVRMMVWEGAAVICLAGLLMTGNLMYLAYTLPVLGLMIIFQPNKSRIVSDLNLKRDEENQL